jgi:hypothetical protein
MVINSKLNWIWFWSTSIDKNILIETIGEWEFTIELLVNRFYQGFLILNKHESKT